jgi:hypothetical protein
MANKIHKFKPIIPCDTKICHSVWIYKKPKHNAICPHCEGGGTISRLTIKTNPQPNY